MYNEGYNLFDYLRPYTRQINVSTLLNTNNDLFYNNIINYLKPCDCVFVKLDYYPKEHNPIALEFYNKRLAQINYLLSHNLKRHCKVVFTKG